MSMCVFSCTFPYKMPSPELGSGIFPVNFHTNGSCDMSMCVFSCTFPNKMPHMCALLCLLSYVCSPMCALLCALIWVLLLCSHLGAPLVLSYLCSPLCSHLYASHLCALLCALICVLLLCSRMCALLCSLMCVLSYVCSDVSSSPLVSSPFAPPTLFGLFSIPRGWSAGKRNEKTFLRGKVFFYIFRFGSREVSKSLHSAMAMQSCQRCHHPSARSAKTVQSQI